MLGRYSGVDIGSLSMTDLLEDLLTVFQKNHLKALLKSLFWRRLRLKLKVFFREFAPNIDLKTLAKDYFLEYGAGYA